MTLLTTCADCGRSLAIAVESEAESIGRHAVCRECAPVICRNPARQCYTPTAGSHDSNETQEIPAS